MSEYEFTVDPDSIDKERVKSWIEELKSLPNVNDLLDVPESTEIVVTDNKNSRNLTKGNSD